MPSPEKDITPRAQSEGRVPLETATQNGPGWWARLKGGIGEFLSPAESARYTETDYFASFLQSRSSNGAVQERAPLLVRPAGPIYHSSVMQILSHGFMPLSTAQLVSERRKALALEGDAALFRGFPIADLWGMPLATCDMVAHLGLNIKLIPAAYFLENLLRRQMDSNETDKPLRVMRGTYVISAEEYAKVPGEVMDFDNSHYCYSPIENQELAIRIWKGLVGEAFEDYRDLLLRTRGKPSMEVWFQANWAAGAGDLALVHPWHLGRIAEGSKLESLHPVCEFPLFSPSCFVSKQSVVPNIP